MGRNKQTIVIEHTIPNGHDLLAGTHSSLFSYLHDLCSKFITMSQSASQHGLSELNEQGDEVPHPIT